MASHGERAAQNGHGGREYWSRRFPRGTAAWGWFGKHLTHRRERREARRLERELLEGAEERLRGYLGIASVLTPDELKALFEPHDAPEISGQPPQRFRSGS